MRKISIFGILIIGVLASVFALNYMVRGANPPAVYTGTYLLRDWKLTNEELVTLGQENPFSQPITIPNQEAEGTVTYCCAYYADDVNINADINKDGKINSVDYYFVEQSYGCEQGQSCWEQSLATETCWFTYAGRDFQDVNNDCFIDQTDIDLARNTYWGQATNPTDPTCDTKPQCRADVNKDGTVDIKDVMLLSAKNGKVADKFVNYANVKKKMSDTNSDGKIDVKDVYAIGKNYGFDTVKRKCFDTALQYVSGWTYKASATCPIGSPYYITVTYQYYPAGRYSPT